MKITLSLEDIEFIKDHHGAITVKQISDRRKVQFKLVSQWCKENKVYPVGFNPNHTWSQGKKAAIANEVIDGHFDINQDYSPL